MSTGDSARFGSSAPCRYGIPRKNDVNSSEGHTLIAFSRDVSTLLGPALGAGLVALMGPMWAFAFDGLSFVFSAGCLLAMRQATVGKADEQAGETSQGKAPAP